MEVPFASAAYGFASVPQPHRTICTAREHSASIRRKGHRKYGRRVSNEAPQFATRRNIPQTRCTVSAAREHLTSVQGKHHGISPVLPFECCSSFPLLASHSRAVLSSLPVSLTAHPVKMPRRISDWDAENAAVAFRSSNPTAGPWCLRCLSTPSIHRARTILRLHRPRTPPKTESIKFQKNLNRPPHPCSSMRELVPLAATDFTARLSRTA